MKTALALLMAGTVFMSTGTATALAAEVTVCPVCDIEDCTEAGNHLHNGQTYAAHTYDDGHTYHVYCQTEGCDRIDSHSHTTGHHGRGHGGHGHRRHCR